MKIWLVCLLLYVLIFKSYAQETLIDLGNVSYVGIYNGNLVALQESTWDLYSIIENSDVAKAPTVRLLMQGNKQYDSENTRKVVDYIEDDFTIEQQIVRSQTKPYSYKYKLIVSSDSISFNLPIKHLINKFEVSTKNKLIIYEGDVDYNCEGCHKEFFISPDLMVIDYSQQEPKPQKIGIKGSNPKIKGGNIYFYDFFQKYCYDESQYNVYRMPIGEWDKVELVFRQTYALGYIFPDEKFMFARIYEREINNARNILYNLETKSYVYIDGLDLYNPEYQISRQKVMIGASFYSKIHNTPALVSGQFYYLKNLPNDFPHKYRELTGMDDDDRSIIIYNGDDAFEDLPKKVDLTIPIDEKERHYNYPNKN